MMEFDTKKQYGICSTSFNKTIISELQKKGIEPLIFPTVKIEKKSLDDEIQGVISNLDKFDWIIFPDIYAVDYFIEMLETAQIDLFDMDLVRVCAFGESVADRLRFSQIHADLIPSKIDNETIIQAFENYLTENFDQLKFLMIQDSDLTNELAGFGAEIYPIEIYRAEIISTNEKAKLQALLKGGAIDVFLFSGIEEIMNLKLLFSNDSLEKLLYETEVVALEPIAFQYLRENGLRPKLLKK